MKQAWLALNYKWRHFSKALSRPSTETVITLLKFNKSWAKVEPVWGLKLPGWEWLPLWPWAKMFSCNNPPSYRLLLCKLCIYKASVAPHLNATKPSLPPHGVHVQLDASKEAKDAAQINHKWGYKCQLFFFSQPSHKTLTFPLLAVLRS